MSFLLRQSQVMAVQRDSQQVYGRNICMRTSWQYWP